MGKRSNFARIEKDFYRTPKEAVAPLLPFLPAAFTYIEPCAGDGALIDALPGRCVHARDIDPKRQDIYRYDALNLDPFTAKSADFIITNPPWSRNLLHPMIDLFARMCPTWLLFDADWMHTRQAAPYAPLCRMVVSIGRVKWIPDSKYSGKDNAAWYLFDAQSDAPTQFMWRDAA